MKYHLKEFSQVCEDIFKHGCGKDMFMVDNVSFPGLWYLLGEYVYTLLSAGIYQAQMTLGAGDLSSTPLYLKDFQVTGSL